MSIRFIKDANRFVLNTKSTTYAFEIVFDRFLCHTYYGKKTNDIPAAEMRALSFAPYMARR